MRRVSAAPRHINDTWGTTPGIDTGEFRYKAFISYSWSDRKWGEWLHHALETYRAPKSLGGSRLHPIFKDREEEAAGASIGDAIETALGNSEFLIVLCSPRSAASPWVNREVAWFKANRDAKKILTLIVDGEPMASAKSGREAEECFPRTLLFKVGADLTPTDEFEDAPLAADARESGDGKRGAKLKLAAAILGVGLDTLVNRDNRRRAQRRRIVMAVMAASIAVLSGITLFAVSQRNAAVAARIDADKQREEAQSLVEFMLTDLRQRLDAVGRLDILDAVATRLLQSYEKEDLTKLDPDALGRRARVLLLLGEVESTRGKLDDALARYKDAAAATAELLKRDPDDQQRIFDHAQSVYWVGDIALKRGDMAAVTEYWTQYRDYGARLVELNPDKDEWRTELAYGHRNLASLALDQGDLKGAEQGFLRALEISAALAADNPNDKEMQIALAQDYYWLGAAQERRGAFEEAEQSNEREAEIYAAMLARDSIDDVALRLKSVNGRVRARIVMANGEADRALAILLAQVPLHEERIRHDPQNTRWLAYYGLLQIDIGAAHLALDEVALARLAARASLEKAELLLTRDPASIEWLTSNLWRGLLLAARCAIESGDMAEAVSHLTNAERLAADLSVTHNASNIDQLIVRTSLLNAKIAKYSGDLIEARLTAAELVESVARLLPKSGFENQTDFLEVLMLADESAGAVELAKALDAAGYRHPDFLRLKKQLAAPEGEVVAPRDD